MDVAVYIAVLSAARLLAFLVITATEYRRLYIYSDQRTVQLQVHSVQATRERRVPTGRTGHRGGRTELDLERAISDQGTVQRTGSSSMVLQQTGSYRVQ